MSERTKSLIYRELTISKKFYLSIIGTIALFLSLCWLVRLSLNVGNLARLVDTDPDAYSIMDMASFALGTVFASFVIGVLNDCSGVPLSDIKSNWKQYSYVLPVTPLEAAKVKFIIKVFWLFVSIGFSTFNCWLNCIISDRKMTLDIFILLLWLNNAMLIISVLKETIMLYANREREAVIANAAEFILMIPVFIGLTMLTNETNRRTAEMAEALGIVDDDNTDLMMSLSVTMDILKEVVNKVKYFALPVMAVLLAVSFFTSYKAIQRREK